MLLMLDPIINAIRAPLNAIRSAVFGVKNAKGSVKFDVSRLKGAVGEYGSEVGGLGAEAKGAVGGVGVGGAAGAKAKKKKVKKKMGLFSKKKKCPSCGAKLHASWDTCPDCGWGEKKAAAPAAAAPMAAPQVSSGGKARTVSINVGPGGPGGGTNPGIGWLVPLEGEMVGELLQLKSQKTTVGSRPECDVVVKDQSISGKHAEFVLAPGGFRITDLGSTNGTFVNDKKIQTTDLVDNDNVRLGLINFKFKALN